ncbi:hypothetical protein BS78_07G179500 [Paspalum vaginatum]|nr:hypothetical protein BS78_07G179500 [Paspalum vaginatum]
MGREQTKATARRHSAPHHLSPLPSHSPTLPGFLPRDLADRRAFPLPDSTRRPPAPIRFPARLQFEEGGVLVVLSGGGPRLAPGLLAATRDWRRRGGFLVSSRDGLLDE